MYLTIKNLFINIIFPLNFLDKVKFIKLFTIKFLNKKNKKTSVSYEVIRFKNNDLALSSSAGDMWSFLEIFDIQEYKTIFKLIGKEKITPFTLIDLGANIGLTYVYFKDLNLIKNYIGVEPLKNNIRLLHFNTFSEKSLIIQKAVWTDNNGVNFSDDQEHNSNFISKKGKLKIQSVTLEEIFQNQTEDIFLKMDIEGAEYEILNKDLKLISKKVKYLAIEFHNIKSNNYSKQLEDISKNFKILEVKKDQEDYSLVFGLNLNL